MDVHGHDLGAVDPDLKLAAAAIEEAFIKAIETAEKSVVSISRDKRQAMIRQDNRMPFFGRDPRGLDPSDPNWVPNEFGAGVVIDKAGLILTNYHVAGDGDTALVMFPAYKGNKVIAEREYYQEHLKADGIKGKVVARDKKADLALIQLESIPDHAVAISDLVIVGAGVFLLLDAVSRAL